MRFTRDDVDWLADVPARAGRDEVMPRFKALRDGGVRLKSGAFDPVTGDARNTGGF